MPVSENNLQQIFSEETEYILFLNNDSICKLNFQSCDCDSVLIKLKNQNELICIECNNEVLDIKNVSSFDSAAFSLKHTPSRDVHISFVSAEFNENGVEGLKFRYCDRYLFFFANEDGGLIITISQYDLFEEDDTPIPDNDDSNLYLEKI